MIAYALMRFIVNLCGIMNVTKFGISLLVFVLIMTFFVGSAMAATYSGSCRDNLTWTLTTETGVLEIDGTGNMGNYYYLDEAEWYQYRDIITSVSLSSGVTSIGDFAFWGCTALASVVIPDGVTSIGQSAFNGCNSLTSVVIPDSVTSIGWDAAFSGCSSLTSIVLPAGLTSIGQSAFAGCSSLTTIIIPADVTSIGDWAFRDCYSLTTVVIPESVTSIGDSAFSGCSSLTSIVLPDGITSIEKDTFSDCSNLTSIVIPNNVTSIGIWAFRDCYSLTSIVLPDGIRSIEQYAFSGCNSLTSIVLPDGVRSIEQYAFSGCSSLTSIVLPASLTSIEKDTFSNCSNLTSIVIPNNVTSIGVWAFRDCYSLTSIEIPDGVTSIEDWAFRDCYSLTSIEIPDGVTFIGTGAFSGCISLTSIEIPDSVTSLGAGAFMECSSLKTVKIGNSVTSIGDSTFYLCVNLTSINLPSSITSIGKGAFAGCRSLTSIEIPDTVTSIGDRAFAGCSSLTTIIIPAGVTSIGDWAFISCSSLTSIEIPDSVMSIGDRAFSGCISLTTIIIPAGVTSIGDWAFCWCDSLKTVTIGNAITSIGNSSFNYCPNLEVVDLTDAMAISSVGDSAFGSSSDSAMKPGSVIYVSDEEAVAWFIDGTNYYAPYTQIIVDGMALENQYIIKYDANGGTGSMADQTFTYNTTQNLSSNTFVKNANVFIGWSTVAGGPVVYTDGQSVINLPKGAILTLYAVWIPLTTYSGSCGDNLTWMLTTETGVLEITGSGEMTNYSYSPNKNMPGWYLYRKKIKTVSLSYGVTSIGDWAFCWCDSLTSIEIPDSLTSIGGNAFIYCTSLTSIEIPTGVTSIGDHAFLGSSLISIEIPDSVTSIEMLTFNGCESLISVSIGNGVTSIGDYAFQMCTALPSIVIPESVTSIGQAVFVQCPNLEVVDLSSNIALSSVGYSAFGYWNGISISLKSGSVIYVSDERTAALFIAGTNYYAPNTSIVVGKPTQEIKYLIKYNANGGTGSMDDQIFVYNTTQNLSANTFVKNACVFSGWSTAADGPVIYTDGQSVRNLLNINNSTLILYAVWTPGETPTIPDSSLPLTAGWNFISVPKTLNASNNTAESLFGSVDTSDRSILGYNTQTGTWVPITDEMEVIYPLNGYWIYAAAETAIDLTYPSMSTALPEKTLYPGWNAVGLSSGKNTAAHNALVCLGDAWKTVIPWNLAAGMYDPAIINGGSGTYSPDRLMTLGNGYWIYVDAQSTLVGLAA
ncbi:hypothetical protein SDC9_39896 [bioreactor metagenome]|uniref:Uncharacterized protein n=1 Tax=bioreactor metagenome TaxID=1076179 RepID=A0A644VQT8_9ZZZZ